MQDGDSITCAEVAAFVSKAMPDVAITRIKLAVTAMVKSLSSVKSVQRKGIVKLAGSAPGQVAEVETDDLLADKKEVVDLTADDYDQDLGSP